MQAYLTLVRRELGALFVSLTGYAVMAGVLFVMGAGFALLLKDNNDIATSQPVTEQLFGSGLFWLILLVASPFITMRSFALEKHTGTFETLMTAPISDLQVTLAKFTGALIFFMLIWLPVFSYPYVVSIFSMEPVELAAGPLFATLLGMFLIGCVYMSSGCLASALTQSQVIAALNGFGIGTTLFLLSALVRLNIPQDTWQFQALLQISMLEHLEDFTRGIVDTRHLVFYVSVTTLFLYATHKVVQARRWK